MNELVSIIVPVYKVEDYIQRCVDSILRQTYKNLEIILVEDGSPDNSGIICDAYAKLDGRVKVIHKKNGGLSDARNVGIENALGAYITFLDSDDWIHDDYINHLYKLLKRTNSDISMCNYVKTSVENIGEDVYDEGDFYEYSNIDALSQLKGDFKILMVVACCKLYKRNLFDQIRFPVGRIHEDEFTTYKLIYKANKIAQSKAALYFYWMRDNSIMGSGFNIRYWIDKLDAFEERGDFFGQISMVELQAFTYETVFLMYISIIRSYQFNEGLSRNNYFEKFRGIKYKLRNNSHKKTFKLLYEISFLSPNFAGYVYNWYMFVRRHNFVLRNKKRQ